MSIRRYLAAGVTSVAAAALLVTPAPIAAAETDPGRQTYQGFIDGAEYRVEMPEDWNGTLLLYSHGYAPDIPDFEWPLGLTNRSVPYGESTEKWLLDHGYALAGSNYKGVTGYVVKQGVEDQLKLMDWIKDNVGTPERTIATGQSQGGTIAVQLAEQNPDLFDGVVNICAGYDPHGQWNTALDVAYAVKTLLAPDADIPLARYADADEATAAQTALTAAVDEAAKTPEGRARLALVGSLGNIAGWYSARFPEPTNDEEFIDQQKEWVKGAYLFLSTTGRFELEGRAGGNPSSNTDVDYARQLVRSAQTEKVVRAYQRAEGSDLKADLRALARGERVTADGEAVRFMYRHFVPEGELRAPMITVHSTGDGGAVPDQERWYAEQVRRNGSPSKLRHLWVHRGGHCTVTGAEEILAVQAVDRRIRTGSWPTLSPSKLNAAAGAFPADLQRVFDFSTFTDAPDTPKVTEFTPSRYLRPSR